MLIFRLLVCPTLPARIYHPSVFCRLRLTVGVSGITICYLSGRVHDLLVFTLYGRIMHVIALSATGCRVSTNS